MARITFRTSAERKQALEELKSTYGLNVTDMCNDALRVWLDMHDENLPEHLEKDTRHEDIVSRNKHRMRRLRFKQRVHDTLVGLLEDERGNPRRFPPEPDKVEEDYFESLHEEVEKEYEKYSDEYHEFLNDELRWYTLQHPDYNPADGRTKEECISYIAEHLERGRDDFAAQLARKMQDSGSLHVSLTADKLIQEAHELRTNEGWRDQWDESVRANWGEEA